MSKRPRSEPRVQSKYWCFTINNEQYKDSTLPTRVFQYCVMGNEVGDNGTPHIQGFLVMNVRTTLSRMKSLLPRAHLEVMRDIDPINASNYCKKGEQSKEEWKLLKDKGPNFGLNADWFESGDLLAIDHRGGASGGNAKRARYTECIEAAEKGDFTTIKENHPDMYWNSYHTMKRIAMDNPKKCSNLKELKNEWIYGRPGIGKSRRARFENPDHYIKSHNKWWLGYKLEPTVLIDDLGRTDAVWIGEYLKQWADHYPFPAETKGDGSVLRPERIIVTSNYTIEELFPEQQLQDALLRRFNVVHMVHQWEPPEEELLEDLNLPTQDEIVMCTPGMELSENEFNPEDLD